MKAKQPKENKSVKLLKSVLAFVVVVVGLGALGWKVNNLANAGYFEEHMDNVRHVAADKFLARQMALPNASVLPSGLIFSIEKRGTGDRAPAENEACDLDYHSRFRYWVTYENSRDSPYPPQRAPSSFVPGVSEALQLMREGDRWNLIVPYTLAYGTAGNPADNIPSFVNLRYTIEILKCPQGGLGKTSEEIDAYLKPYLKQPIPPKAAAAASDNADL